MFLDQLWKYDDKKKTLEPKGSGGYWFIDQIKVNQSKEKFTIPLEGETGKITADKRY